MVKGSRSEASVASTSAFDKGKKNAINDANFLNAGRDIGNITFIKCSHPLCQTVANTVLHADSDTVSTPTEKSPTSPGPALVEIEEEDRGAGGHPLQKTSTRTRVPAMELQDAKRVISAVNREEFLPTEAFSRAPSSYEVYIKKMYKLKHGYPLWYPQPDRDRPVEYRRRGVAIGDVGVITFNGGFDFLFNIWLPASHPINPNNLPDDFDSMPRPERRTMFQHSFSPGYNSKISNLDIVTGTIENTKNISFTCKDGGKGGLLSIPHGASTEDLRSEGLLQEFISKNAISWYRYARHTCGIDLDRHSLYLVTGYMKSKTWGIATFDKSVPDRNSLLVIGKSNDDNSPYLTWKCCGEATHTRTGPTPDSGLAYENGLQADENQCLFLRGFKISLSEEVWNKILDPTDIVTTNDNGNDSFSYSESHKPRGSTRSNRNSGSGSGSQSSSHTDLGNKVSITSFPKKDTLFHPLTAINNALLSQVPEARIAITHDNTWSKLVGQSSEVKTGTCTLESSKDTYTPDKVLRWQRYLTPSTYTGAHGSSTQERDISSSYDAQPELDLTPIQPFSTPESHSNSVVETDTTKPALHIDVNSSFYGDTRSPPPNIYGQVHRDRGPFTLSSGRGSYGPMSYTGIMSPPTSPTQLQLSPNPSNTIADVRYLRHAGTRSHSDTIPFQASAPRSRFRSPETTTTPIAVSSYEVPGTGYVAPGYSNPRQVYQNAGIYVQPSLTPPSAPRSRFRSPETATTPIAVSSYEVPGTGYVAPGYSSPRQVYQNAGVYVQPSLTPPSVSPYHDRNNVSLTVGYGGDNRYYGNSSSDRAYHAGLLMPPDAVGSSYHDRSGRHRTSRYEGYNGRYDSSNSQQVYGNTDGAHSVSVQASPVGSPYSSLGLTMEYGGDNIYYTGGPQPIYQNNAISGGQDVTPPASPMDSQSYYDHNNPNLATGYGAPAYSNSQQVYQNPGAFANTQVPAASSNHHISSNSYYSTASPYGGNEPDGNNNARQSYDHTGSRPDRR
ncbi:hypothetical protein BDQ17DRAFT_1323192 [Cyathus striatus]|nr:hypothetical protein BDQ17DRAFT_1323192 [Cyathus striatus]